MSKWKSGKRASLIMRKNATWMLFPNNGRLYPIKVHHPILYPLNFYIVEMLNYCSDPLPTPLGTIAATAYNKTVNSNITFTCDDRFQPASGIPPATRCIPFTHQNGIWQNVTSACIRKFRFLTIEDHSSYDWYELCICLCLHYYKYKRRYICKVNAIFIMLLIRMSKCW